VFFLRLTLPDVMEAAVSGSEEVETVIPGAINFQIDSASSVSSPIPTELWPFLGKPFWTNGALSFMLIPPPRKPEPMLDTNLLQVTFVLAKSEFMPGERVECECIVKNISDKDRFYSIRNPANDIEFEVLSAPLGAGSLLSDRFLAHGIIRTERLTVREKHSYRFLLNPLVKITEAGTYQFRLKLWIGHGEDFEGKQNWSWGYTVQTLTLECRPKDTNEPERIRAQPAGTNVSRKAP
jgi:hypothetical protein